MAGKIQSLELKAAIDKVNAKLSTERAARLWDGMRETSKFFRAVTRGRKNPYEATK